MDDSEYIRNYKGIGPKIYALYTRHALNENRGIGVDVHVHRILNRIGLVETKRAEQTQREIEEFELDGDLNKILVGFGQKVCLSKRPRCDECKAAEYCKYKKDK